MAMQFPSTAENSVNDTSIAVICGLAISNRRPSSWHRSESAARAAEAALSREITIEQRNTMWRYKAVSPWQICFIAAMRLAQQQANAKKEKFLEG
jgi:hypothetical protein